ncbi:MAG: hypothetical protein U0798_18530 [Gemmataceae bacterium]
MRFQSYVGVACVAAAMFAAGCSEGRKPSVQPMATVGPNQFVFAVPGMT